MARHFLAQIRIPSETGLPRDDFCINPCFRWMGVLSDLDDFASDLAASVHDKLVGQPRPVNVKMYDLQGTKPIYPAGAGSKNPASPTPGATIPRELAVCLSFYGEHNRPRNRGRLYIPWCCMTTSSASLENRPSVSTRTAVGSFAPVFANAGGLDVQWIVWSRANQAATQVQNWFVDDEWDIIRKRGLRPSARTTGAIEG
jgi:hypothetical protein